MSLGIDWHHEYGVKCCYKTVRVAAARWVTATDPTLLKQFKNKCDSYLASDGRGYLTYLAPSQVNLDLVQERWPALTFQTTREQN